MKIITPDYSHFQLSKKESLSLLEVSMYIVVVVLLLQLIVADEIDARVTVELIPRPPPPPPYSY